MSSPGVTDVRILRGARRLWPLVQALEILLLVLLIGAVAIEALKLGCVPIGFHDGFEWLAQRYTDEQHDLTVEECSRIHLTGGVLLGYQKVKANDYQEACTIPMVTASPRCTKLHSQVTGPLWTAPIIGAVRPG